MPVSLTHQIYSSDVLASIALVAILSLLRFVFARGLRRREDLTQQVIRRWSANARNVLLLVGLIGLVMIWAPQLRTFALSLTAFAVAMVVAMKELILCLSGSALRTLTRAFSVGDYIELGGIRGEVLDHNLIASRLMEMDRREGSLIHTGREVIVPHSLLFGAPLRVEAAVTGKACHTILLTFEPHSNLFAARSEIRDCVISALAPTAASKTNGLHSAATKTPDPNEIEVSLSTSDIGKYRIEVRFPIHPELARSAEQAVICAIGNLIHNLRESG